MRASLVNHPEITSLADIFIIEKGNRNEGRADWKRRYTEIHKRVQEAKKKGKIDDELLSDLWYKRSNGVSSIMQGALSGDAFETLKEELRQLTLEIFKGPSLEVYEKVHSAFEDFKQRGITPAIYRASINRVFGACHPHEVTSSVARRKFQTLIEYLNRTYSFGIPEEQNWLEKNLALKKIVNQIKPEQVDDFDANIALWKLYEDVEKAASDGKSSEQHGSSGIAESKEAYGFVKTQPLNQILFGPPGTGKTYTTIEKAVEIIDSSVVSALKTKYQDHTEYREALKREYEALAKGEQICFTTFHQSFSYEDFVEGIKAESADGGLTYNVEPGIFRKICEHAETGGESISVEKAIEKFKSRVSEEPIDLKTATGKVFTVSYKGGKTFGCLPHASADKLILPANVEHVKSVIMGHVPENLYCSSYVKALAAHIKSHFDLSEVDKPAKRNTAVKPYVLIIDEINRGNISRIFGELITLIEADKRSGGAESLSITLPYSKKAFSVPSNVYILGTMNTADKSLAQLDIALRRRFTFVEMPPKPELLKSVYVHGIEMNKLLNVMNDRIEVLLDRDHLLGHSYFMPLVSANEADRECILANIFRHSIVPLLQEYFFDDWERIQWVLNDPAKDNDHKFILNSGNTSLEKLFPKDISTQVADRRYRINESAFTAPEAYEGIVKGSE